MSRAQPPGFFTHLTWALEGFALCALFGFFALLPVTWASGLAGNIARVFGPFLSASRRAEHHIRKAIPALSQTERQEVIATMWDNLGRVIAEYPHLREIAAHRVEVQGIEIVQNALLENKGILFVSGHLANWEVLIPAFVHHMQMQMALTYRTPNNPMVAGLLQWARQRAGAKEALAKQDRRTGPRLLRTLKSGGAVGMLIDQKYNEGVAVPFFGLSAMTNPAPVRLARRYGAALIMVRIRRLPHARFAITIHPPLSLENRTDVQVLEDMNTILESWIRADSGGWFWLHRRWGNYGL